jgi:6-phosphogluconate dehydrogenase
MHEVFKEWNEGELQSYLIEITRDILAYRDEDGTPMVDKILDTAGQKGTGKWTVISSQEMGIPITLIAEAVYSRCVSALKDQRVEAARIFPSGSPRIAGDRGTWIGDIRKALYASKIISYTQGYMLMRAAARNRVGTSTTAASPKCGAAAASSAACSWRRSRRRSTRTRS